MKAYECLYAQLGENATTPKDFRGLATDFPDIDLQQKIACCRNWDDNSLVEVNRYAVHTVNLPDWLEFSEYANNRVKWEFLFYFLRGRIEDIDTFNPEVARLLMQIENSDQQKAFFQLMTSKLRSAFKLSLRNQVTDWLNMPKDQRKYNFPLSGKQLNSLVYMPERYGSDHYAYEHFRSSLMLGWKA